jgi:hypothetical protein
MTKRLEEEFNLESIDEIMRDPLNTKEHKEERSLDTIKHEISEYEEQVVISERIDGALPAVHGLDQVDIELNGYANKAMETFDELVDLGRNVEDRHAAAVYDSASKMLQSALQAKQSILDKKLKMVELQMRKAKLDLDEKKANASLDIRDPNSPEAEGIIIGDRASLLSEIMSKIKDVDK